MPFTLVSSDGKEFNVERDVIKMSGTIEDMLAALSDDESSCLPIPLPNVTGEVLALILEWCEQHKADPVEEEKDEDDVRERSLDIPEWDEKNFFKKMPLNTLLAVYPASSYLHVKGLFTNCAKVLAKMIKGKSTEEIRAHFHIVNDFTPDEEAAIKKENEWCES